MFAFTANTLLMITISIRLVLIIRQITSVSGSYQRHYYTTLALAVCFLEIALWVVHLVGNAIDGDWIIASLDIVAASFTALVIKRLWNEDNWFNNSFKKLKKWVKNLKFSLPTLAIPLPSTG